MNKIKELRYKKTRQQLRYVQLELEETQMVYEDCVDKFNIEFKEELMDSRDSEDPITDIDDSHLKIDSTIDKKILNDIYKKIAVKVHPDKQNGDEEQFKELNRANKNNDYGTMLEMAEELGIGIKDNEESYLNNTKQIRAIIKSITDMQTTLAWQWVHTENHQKSAKIAKITILIKNSNFFKSGRKCPENGYMTGNGFLRCFRAVLLPESISKPI